MIVPVSEHLKLVVSEDFTFCNCLLIEDKQRGIIETGMDKNLLSSIEPHSIDTVLYTHHHFDHVRHNEFFPQAYISIHGLDYPALTDFNLFFHYNSFDQWKELMPGYDYEEAAYQVGLTREEVIRSWHINGTFENRDIVDFGNTCAEIIHTPGHSAGHCAFWFPREEFLFSGDICLTRVGPWYGEIYASPEDMINSINYLIELKPSKIATSHIPEICKDGVERLKRYRDRIYKRDERVYSYLKQKPADLHELAGQHLIYKIHPTPFVLFWEKLILLKHLERLQNQGLVEKFNNKLYRAKQGGWL